MSKRVTGGSVFSGAPAGSALNGVGVCRAAAAILVGGRSSRMGFPKALLRWGEETFLQRQARIFSGFSERVLSVSGLEDPSITLPGFRRVEDVRPGLGPIGGIYSVLQTCESERVFFAPCDMPLLNMEVAGLLLAGVEDGDACVAEMDGRIEPLSAVYAKSALPVIERCISLGEYRLLAALDAMDCRRIPLAGDENRRAFTNINTPEELARLLAITPDCTERRR